MLNQTATEKLQTAIDRILEIDDAAIADQLSTNDLQAIVDAIDPEFNCYTQRHCNKTGKPLGKFSAKAISQLIHIHGKPKAKFALEAMHTSQIAVEWLYTDSDALSQLSKLDPVAYFVYAATTLFAPSYKIQKLLPWEIHQERTKGYDAVNELYYTDGCDIMVGKTNELMRRLLGIANPNLAFSHIQFTQTSIAGNADSKLSLEMFIAEIESAIIALVEHNWREKNTVSRASIADLKNQYGGATAFHQQVKIRGLSQVEAILYDMRDFMDGKSADQMEVIVGLHPNQKGCKPKAETFKLGDSTTLKIKTQPEPETELKPANPFAAMFAKQRGAK